MPEILSPVEAAQRWSNQPLGTMTVSVRPDLADQGYVFHDKVAQGSTTGTYDMRVPTDGAVRGDTGHDVDYGFVHLPGVHSPEDAVRAAATLRADQYSNYNASWGHGDQPGITYNSDHLVFQHDGEFYTAPASDVIQGHSLIGNLRGPSLSDLRDGNAKLAGWLAGHVEVHATNPELVGVFSDAPTIVGPKGQETLMIHGGYGEWTAQS